VVGASRGETPEIRRRFRVMAFLASAGFALLLGRLWQLQILQGTQHLARAHDNLLTEIPISSVRGQILDARGRLVADNRPSYDVYVTPRFFSDETLERLGRILALPHEQLEQMRRRIDGTEGLARYRPKRLLRDIDRDQLARIETARLELAGVRLEWTPQRVYPMKSVGAHLVGYLNEIGPGELQARRDEGYAPGDLIGRAGVEWLFEASLRGHDGRERIVTDARGVRRATEELRELGLTHLLAGGREEARAGHNVTLTIDFDLQRAAERAIGRYRTGAAVAIETDTGRILAMASRPGFDPNLFTGHVSPEQQAQLEQDPRRPLIDRTVREDYFPGSIFKALTALAALRDHLIDVDEKLECKGRHELGGHTFRCAHAHGWVNLEQALARSCNVYFYQLAERVGMDRLADISREFGLGAPTGLGLNGEVGGFVTTKDWYHQNWKGGFRLGFTLNAAIGQGNTKMTVLQAALLYATIANGGRLFVPQIVRRVQAADGRVLQEFTPQLRRTVGVAPEHMAWITRALAGVVEDPRGTAYGVKAADGIRVAGKTGTAQVRPPKRGAEDASHAWFVALAPAEAPRISVAVLIEHGGQGSKVAAPVAIDIVNAYFRSPEVRMAAAPEAP
jgi:penicillin-binding protein 2